MALSFLLVLAATVILIRPETPVTKALHQNSLECCGEKQRVNNSCSNDTHCEPGCFLRFLENSNTVCIFCDSAAVDLENITVCTYNYTMERKNHTTVTTVIPKIAGGPGVAASLLLGTLLISLFLILSVASFFYLKRSNRLPRIFYRRNKAFIFQPSETAVMIPSSSVRKPRYVRRERPSATSTGNSATVPTTTTTPVYNV
uniref:Si:ch211-157b11.12 n=1 Tax=Dicentrarchus labrax TaxID=13489 RepID=A0A8P4JY12_DICLA